MTVTVKGLDRLHKNHLAIQQHLHEALSEALLNCAEEIETEIRARIPEKTGKLKAHLNTLSEQSAKKVKLSVEIEHSDESGQAHYAIFQEYGTSKMPARPFFRPGILAAKPHIKTRLEQAIETVLHPYVD